MKILLLGANSYVGSRLYVELSKYHGVVGTFHNKKIFDESVPLDITDQKAVMELIANEKPEVIIHCANNASSKFCEENPEQAIAVNQEATKYIVESANSVGAKLIYISSFAAISHEDLYGRTKLESEKITKGATAGYLILQPGIIIGISPKIKKENGFFSSLMENIDGN
jgi:dTDP-4-dehydrorhamnose reductase